MFTTRFNLSRTKLFTFVLATGLVLVALTLVVTQTVVAQDGEEAPVTETAVAENSLHPTFPLLDVDGNHVLESGKPISTMRTCNECHDTEFIASHSFHADVGLSDMTAPGETGNGRAWDTSLGLFGKWDPITYRYLSPQTDATTDLTTAEWIKIFGVRHAGGELLIEESLKTLEEEFAVRLLSLPGEVTCTLTEEPGGGFLQTMTENRQAAIQKSVSERNARFFEAEAEKLDGWADDLKLGLEREIKELDRQIKEARRAATAALTLEEKLAGQRQIKTLEAQRNQKRRSLFDAQDEVDRQREALIKSIEGKLTQRLSQTRLFHVRWTIT